MRLIVSGCYECSQRRVDCDRSLPTCFKCLRKGIDCSGFGQYRFVTSRRNSTQRRTRNASQQLAHSGREYHGATPGDTVEDVQTQPASVQVCDSYAYASTATVGVTKGDEQAEVSEPESSLTPTTPHSHSRANAPSSLPLQLLKSGDQRLLFYCKYQEPEAGRLMLT